MKKLLTFLTMALLFYGVGWAEDVTDTWTATNGSLGDVISGSSANGSITTTGGNSWNYTRTLYSGYDYVGWTEDCVQLGKNGGVEEITFSTSDYGTKTIKSVSVVCSSYNAAHKVSITVGGTTYLASTATSKWTTIEARTGTGNSSGEIVIEFTHGTRALYIKSITVVYDNGGSTTTSYDLDDGSSNGTVAFTVDGSPVTSAEAGATVTATATANTGYVFSSWTEPSNVTNWSSNGNTATFTMPAAAVTVTANFTAQASGGSGMIVFDNNGSDATAEVTSVTLLDYTIQGASYVSSFSDISKVYKATTGIKFSSSSVNGSLTINLSSAAQQPLTKIIVNAKKYGSDNASLSVNGTSTGSLTADYANYEIACNGNTLTEITLAATKRLYVKSITLVFQVAGQYTIECADNLEHGSIEANASSADADATITITATPDAGYALSTVTVTPASGTAFQATVNGNNATFTMPASNVTVTATFSKAWNAITTSILPANCGGEVWVYSGTEINGVKNAQIGDDIYFRVVTDQNNSYQLESLVIKDANNTTITYVDDPSDSGWKWQDNRYGAKFKFEMPATAVTITATFKRGDLYLLGTANEVSEWTYTGPQLTYDGTKYSIDVYFKGAGANDKFGYFSFATKGDASNWDDLYGKRLGSSDGNETVINSDFPEKNLGWNANAFKIPAGIYTIEVAADFSKVTITPKTVSLTFSPAAGTVYQGAEVTVSSNLYTLLHAINSNLSESAVANEVSLDGTTFDESVTLNTTGTVPVTGRATYGYIEVSATADYTVNAVNGDEYILVESENDLVAGEEYIIANESGTAVLGAVSSNVGASVTADFVYNSSAKTITLQSGCDAARLTLGGQIGAWTLHNGTGYLAYTKPKGTSKNNNLFIVSDASDDGATWAIDPELMPSDYELINNVYNSERSLQFNSDRFCCYTSHQGKVALYKKVSGSTPTQTATPVISPESGNIVGFSQEVTITGSGNIYYTMTSGENPNDPADPTVSSTPYTGPFYVQVDNLGHQVKIKAVAKEGTKDISNVTAITNYLFVSPAAPSFSLNNGTYVAPQSVELTTATDGCVIYYSTTATTAADIIAEGNLYESAISLPVGTTTVYAVTVYNDTHANKAANSSVRQGTYTIVAPLAITFSPAGGTYLNSQSVTINVSNAVGNVTIYYTTDGSDPSDASNENRIAYNGAITVDQTMTINAYASDSRTVQQGKTATATATYNIGVQPVEYSPIPGDYYKGANEGDITVEMFSITPNAKIYYTMTDDGTDPADPSTSNTLYNGGIALQTGKTYKFKAIAVAGTQVTAIAPATYTISELQSGESGWVNIDAMNTDDNYTTDDVLLNPVQVVYMSTWRNNGEKPEFCFVRDNSGYGMIYFGGKNVTDYNTWAKFQMGDWLPGNKISGTLNVWSDSFINELGGSSGTLSTWPSADEKLGNSDILPEETTNLAITQGWTYTGGAYTGTDYASYIDAEKNLFGHYVHMRKNTISDVTGTGQGTQKHIGIITDQSGVPLNYYDGMYLFSGYNGTPDYNQAFFDNIQNNGGTFDIYAIVYFYGTNAKEADYSYAPYEIFPIDFMWIYKPKFNIPSGTYMVPQNVELTCETAGAQIWYKTDDMEDFALYTGPITVDATTTIEAYSTIPTKYNDVMESVINSITINIGSIEAPVITQESIVKTVGESTSTTITCETDGATIYYTTDGSDPKTSETRIEYTAGTTLTFTETTTVRAIAYQEVEGTGYYSAEAEARTYTFVKSNGIEYDLVTSDSQLNENDVYVIVNKANNMALGRTQNANNRDAAGVMFKNTDKTIVYENDEVAQFTLKKVGNNWYLQTANSGVNGSLYVGDGNTLLTETTPDGNAEATISIDADAEHQAHISFMYNYETTRYLRYYNSGKVFSTYTSENSNLPVALYRRAVTSLANIEKEGTQGQQYTVADRLLIVAANNKEHVIWAKDEGNVSIDRTEIKDGQIDYMRYVAENDISNAQDAGVLFQDGDWDQSNWVMIKLLAGDANYDKASRYVNAYILPASLTGRYTDDLNYTIEAMTSLEEIVDATGGEFTPNVYCAANFLDANLNLTAESQGAPELPDGDRHFFFVNPKVQEVATITYAVWDGTKFVMPARNVAGTINGAGLTGAFEVGWKYNGSTPTLETGVAYQFTAVLNKVAQQGNAPRRAESTVEPGAFSADAGKVVYPLDLTADESHIVTEVRDLTGNAVREVASVKYVSITGVVSDKPFEGMNIIVTRYTDGTTSTAKVMR